MQMAGEPRLPVEFNRRNAQILGICNIPGSVCRCLVSSSERKVYDTHNPNDGCDTRYNINQLQILANGKAFFAGVGEQGHPGAI